MPVRVTIWNEYRHETKPGKPQEIYPTGIHGALADHLRTQPGVEVRTATLDQPEHGLSDEVLKSTDVMLWWGHMAHGEVSDVVAAKVQQRVLEGMGLIVLHSGHLAKPFLRLMGTSGALKWREDGLKEILWVTKPGHPITAGITDHFVLEHEEMYGEHFDIPEPDELLLLAQKEGSLSKVS